MAARGAGAAVRTDAADWLVDMVPETNPLARAIVWEFRNAMQKLGWVEGKDIHIEYRYAAAEPARFKAYAAELVGLAPDILLATTAPSATALPGSLTRSIPIVFVLVPDPVGLGFVGRHSAGPGGHMTGFISFDAPIIGKWVQLLKEIAPAISRVAAIYNPDTALSPSLDREIAAAASFGVTVGACRGPRSGRAGGTLSLSRPASRGVA